MSSVQTRQRPQTAEGCPECAGDVRQDGDESVCVDCGLVVDADRLDRGPEWNRYNEDECRRVGLPLTPIRHDDGLSTKISWTRGVESRQMRRLRVQNQRYNSKHDQNQAKILAEVQRMVSALGWGNAARDQACHLARQAHDAGLAPGRALEGIAAAAIYAVARIERRPERLPDVVAVSRVGQDWITNAYRAMNRELGLPTPPPDPATYVPRIASALDLDDATRLRAEEFVERWKDSHHSGHCIGAGVAAGAVYLAAKRDRVPFVSQADVAEVVDVSCITLRARRDELREVIGGDRCD